MVSGVVLDNMTAAERQHAVPFVETGMPAFHWPWGTHQTHSGGVDGRGERGVVGGQHGNTMTTRSPYMRSTVVAAMEPEAIEHACTGLAACNHASDATVPPRRPLSNRGRNRLPFDFVKLCFERER
jgi:hypothetical protein